MQKNFAPLRADTVKILNITLVAMMCIAICTRIYLYLYPKDFWSDEAGIFWALYRGSWENILQGKLLSLQCCPLFFAVYNKLLFYFSCTQYTLYFLPTCIGIGLIILFGLLAQKIDGKIYAVVCVFLFCIFKIFLYYSSEFKQYIFEAFMSTAVIYMYIYDLISNDERRFISWKYPIIMSISLLISSPSVFISAGLATTTALYLRFEKAFTLKKILFLFLSRYSLFAIVCLVYYFSYLKNGNSTSMHGYWKDYFFPTTLTEWPNYIKNVFLAGRGLLDQYGRSLIKCIGLIPLPLGIYLLWHKNRFITLALTTPFLFAVIAGFSFYPFVLGASIASRLSLYLLPILLLFVGQALLPPVRYIIDKASTTIVLVFSCFLITCVLCINIFFAFQGMGNEQISSLIRILSSKYTANDFIMISDDANPLWEYYTFIDNVQIPYTLLSRKRIDNASDDELETFFSETPLREKKTGYILYSSFGAVQADRVKTYLETRGYTVDVLAPQNAQLQKVVLH